MLTINQEYKSIYENPNHRKEIKIIVADMEFGEDNIVSGRISGGIFATPGIGNCAARQLELEMFDIVDPPRQAKIEVYYRLAVDGEASDWMPKGVFYVSQRKKTKLFGTAHVTSFVAYDAMLMFEKIWLNDSYSGINWPLTQSAAVNDIAGRIGIEIDARTRLDEQFPVEYPVGENGELTMREVLSGIAVSNVGNWVITDEGKLLLLRIDDIPAETNFLITQKGENILFGGVKISV